MNPNNPAYHKCRGQQDRPADWANVVQDRQQRGQREHILNLAAAETRSMHVAHGRDNVRAEVAVKKALGGSAKVMQGGSRHKHTNLAGADSDLKIVTEKPLSNENRAALRSALGEEFGTDCVDESNPRIHKIRGECGSIDLVPQNATYFGQGFNAGLPHNGFKNNPQARHAVRDVKLRCQDGCREVKGHVAEMAVLRAQQEHPGARFDVLADHACNDLGI